MSKSLTIVRYFKIPAKLHNKTKQKLIYGFVYLLYPVLAVSAKLQLENKNTQNFLTPKSCIHLKKDDSFSPGSSG
jgi:hypothetical protein